jgi:hypothetical protein
MAGQNKIGSAGQFLTLLGFVALLLLASLPILFSFDYWVMGDRSSHLNLDFLFQEHQILGVTACYSYGLLPVFIHHVVFEIFGRDYKPMLGCILASDVLYVFMWTLFLKQLPRGRQWLIAVLAIVPILFEVNPNLAYCVVDVSMLFALLFVLQGKLPLAFAAAVVGCFGVPSLPIVLSLLLFGCIVVEWWVEGHGRPGTLLRRLLPGVLTYAGLFTGLGLFFGFRAMLATALPINGVKFYNHSGWLGLGRSMVFFHPSGHSFKYYLGYYPLTTVTWFMFALLVLGIVSFKSLPTILVRGRFHPARLCMAICFVLIVIFLLVAFGGPGQENIYEPILAVGALVAIASLSPRPRLIFLVTFIVLGALGESGQAYRTLRAWRTTKPSPITYNLYSDPEFAKEFEKVLDLSKTHKLFFFSYATGQHVYYPTLESPDMWFLQPGLMFPSDRQRILKQLDTADIVVVDRTRFHFFQDYDPDVRPRLAAMCLVSVTEDFRIFRRPGLEPGQCIQNGVAPE